MMPFYGGYGMYRFDPTYLLVVAGALLSMWASARVNGTFQKFSQVRSRKGMTGADVARRLLQSQGIYDVSVREVPGQLTDHYDPGQRMICAAAPKRRFWACGQLGEQAVLAAYPARAFSRVDAVYPGGDLDVCIGPAIPNYYFTGGV